MNGARGAPQFLLAEDDELDVEALRRAFARRQIATSFEVARDGIEAIEKLRSVRASNGATWIVILDLDMPRMNGIDFLKHLRADPDLKWTPVFVLSGRKHAGRMREAYDLGVAGYVVKPEDSRNLDQVAEMLQLYAHMVALP